MTDAKRQSVGGKVPVATPNIPSSSTVSQEAALMAAIGAKIRVQTAGPNPLTTEGTLYTVSAALNLLTLTTSTPSAPSTSTYTLIPLSSLTTFQLLSLPPTPFTATATPLPPTDPSVLQTRLANTMQALRAEDARIGRGVTREAQDIFDALDRTLPVRWEGVNILVLDAVMILPPYRSEDCKAGTGAASQSLGRVKIVLEKERKKLAEKAGGAKPAVPAVVPLSGQRKGG